MEEEKNFFNLNRVMKEEDKGNIFAMNLDELLKGAEKATDLIDIERKIVDYFNSDEYIIEQNIELGKNYNNLMNQVVGAEVD